MTDRNLAGGEDLVLDDQVIAVYAREIVASVADVSDLIIYDQAGAPRWVLSSQTNPVLMSEAEQLDMPDLDGPAKRKIDQNDVAYDFPLLQDDTPPLLLRLIVKSPDPASLSYVSDAIAPALDCLGRQIRIDTSLTIGNLAVVGNSQSTNLVASLDSVTLSGSFNDDARKLVNICCEAVGCMYVSVHVPRDNSLIISSDDPKIGLFLETLGGKLLTVQKTKKKPISVRIKLPNGNESNATCIPLLKSQRMVEGLVLLVDSERRPDHTSALRTLGTRITALLENEPDTATLAARSDVLASIDHALNVQSPLSNSLVYFDIDKMHALNDAFGYSSGDRALAMFGKILVEHAGSRDTVAHLGGDRFALFMPGASIDTGMPKAEQILGQFSLESIHNASKSISFSASAGIATTDTLAKGGEELLILAEVAARGAQDRGGNQCASYQDIDSSIIQRRSDVDKVGFLQMALIEDRFTLHAQKIDPINADGPTKFEVLTRLFDKSVDNGNAHQFLQAAERYQMMAALDRWVVNSALQTLSNADNTLEVNLSSFCINVSAQSLQDDTFVDYVEARIEDTNIPPDILCFEITETSLVRHIDRAQRFVKRIQRLGCQVALDDFGTGYSSFAYLKTLPVDILKIDGSFVRDLLECELSNTIVSSVVKMAENIGATTVAEHVESALVRSRLKELGVHYAQGFAIHRPEALESVLKNLNAPEVHSGDMCESADLQSDSIERLASFTIG